MVQRPRPDLRGGCAAMRIPTATGSRGWVTARGHPACYGRNAGCVTRARRCVRCVLWPREFPLVPALPSVGSAGTEVPLFAALSGTMPGSDCFNPFIIDSESLLSSAAPVRRPGRIEALPGPLHGRTCVPGFLDAAEPSRPHESGRSVLPSTGDTASALRMTVFRRSIACPHAPLPTLHMTPHDALRTARGGSGSLHLSSCRTFTAIHLRVSLTFTTASPSFAPPEQDESPRAWTTSIAAPAPPLNGGEDKISQVPGRPLRTCPALRPRRTAGPRPLQGRRCGLPPRSVRRRTLLQDVGGLTYPESDPGIPNSCFLVPHMDPNTLPLWGAVPREFSAAQTPS